MILLKKHEWSFCVGSLPFMQHRRLRLLNARRWSTSLAWSSSSPAAISLIWSQQTQRMSALKLKNNSTVGIPSKSIQSNTMENKRNVNEIKHLLWMMSFSLMTARHQWNAGQSMGISRVTRKSMVFGGADYTKDCIGYYKACADFPKRRTAERSDPGKLCGNHSIWLLEEYPF